MASEWRITPAEDFCSSVRDGTHDSPKPVERGRHLVTSRHIVGGHLDLSNAYLISDADFEAINRRSKVDRWDVLVSMIGTVGEACLIRDEPNFAIKNVGLFKSRGETEGKWLYYYLQGPQARQHIKELSRGTTQQYIPLGALRAFPVLAPGSPVEMKAIVHILGTLDDKIKLNRLMNETLEAMARAIFKSWFVDFDPVRAKAKGRQPYGMDAETAALFPDSFEDSPLGNIPKGWSVASLADFALLNPETWTKATAPDHIEYVDLSSAKWGRIETTTPYLWKQAPSRAQHVLRPGDTIVGIVRPANGSYAFISDDCLTGSTGFAVLRPRKSSLREILYLAATDPDNIKRLARLADGAAYPAVRPDAVYSTEILKAPDCILDCLSRTVGPLLNRLAANDRECRSLAALRDSLLPKLISGEIRVPSSHTAEMTTS